MSPPPKQKPWWCSGQHTRPGILCSYARLPKILKLSLSRVGRSQVRILLTVISFFFVHTRSKDYQVVFNNVTVPGLTCVPSKRCVHQTFASRRYHGSQERRGQGVLISHEAQLKGVVSIGGISCQDVCIGHTVVWKMAMRLCNTQIFYLLLWMALYWTTIKLGIPYLLHSLSRTVQRRFVPSKLTLTPNLSCILLLDCFSIPQPCERVCTFLYRRSHVSTPW